MSRVPRSSRVFRHLHPQALPPTGFGEGSMRMSRCCRVCLDPGSRSRLVGGPPAPSALREPQHQETGAEVSGPWGSSDFYGRDSVSEGSTGWGALGAESAASLCHPAWHRPHQRPAQVVPSSRRCSSRSQRGSSSCGHRWGSVSGLRMCLRRR